MFFLRCYFGRRTYANTPDYWLMFSISPAMKAEPQARPVVQVDIQTIGLPIGEDIGVVGLRTQDETTHHLSQQTIDAAAQIAATKCQPNGVNANHRPNSRSSAASSWVCVNGQ